MIVNNHHPLSDSSKPKRQKEKHTHTQRQYLLENWARYTHGRATLGRVSQPGLIFTRDQVTFRFSRGMWSADWRALALPGEACGRQARENPFGKQSTVVSPHTQVRPISTWRQKYRAASTVVVIPGLGALSLPAPALVSPSPSPLPPPEDAGRVYSRWWRVWGLTHGLAAANP